MTERRYNEDEVALILRNAVDAGTEDVPAAASKGLSLSELKEIGAEVGIDAARLEAAATALDRRDVAQTGTVLRIPATMQLERVVGVRLEKDQLPRLLDVIRQELARQGIVEEVLGGFEWKARGGMGGRYVSIRPEGEQTRIRVLGNFRDSVMAMTLGVGPIAAAGTGALAAALGAATPLLILPIAIAGAAAVSLGPLRYMLNRERHSLDRVLDSLEQQLLESPQSPDDA
ncbi:MAG: hypothetical protein OEZ54_05215 [Gemmatimonadota bacterium]|nr:hypothetical protein [Gemmatimonadota bacterium]